MPNTVRHVFILAWYYFTTAASCREQSISLRVVELCSCIFLLYALAPFSSSFLPLLLAKIRPSTFPLILIFIPTFKLCSQWWKKKKKLLICDKKNINYKRKNLKESFRTLRKLLYHLQICIAIRILNLENKSSARRNTIRSREKDWKKIADFCGIKNINYKRKNLKESFRTLRKFYYTIFKFVLQ